MNNKQFEEVERLLSKSHLRGKCPTCGSKTIEVAPGIEEWPPSTYLNRDDERVECDCAHQVDLFRHYLLAHIPEEYMRLVEDDYFGDFLAWNATTEYIDRWDDFKLGGIGIGYYSEIQGTGKTFLATRIAREAVKLGDSVYYINFRDIMPIYEWPIEQRQEQEDRLKTDTLLVLDEIAKPISNAQHEFFASKFEELIRHRTNYGRITIMTTNLEPEELDRYYERTYSLLSAKQKHCHVAGNDARREGIWDINQHYIETGQRRPIS